MGVSLRCRKGAVSGVRKFLECSLKGFGFPWRKPGLGECFPQRTSATSSWSVRRPVLPAAMGPP